ncbi:hypothetical protein AKJ16_DCAP23924 [Drosera capensis]
MPNPGYDNPCSLHSFAFSLYVPLSTLRSLSFYSQVSSSAFPLPSAEWTEDHRLPSAFPLSTPPPLSPPHPPHFPSLPFPTLHCFHSLPPPLVNPKD